MEFSHGAGGNFELALPSTCIVMGRGFLIPLECDWQASLPCGLSRMAFYFKGSKMSLPVL